MSLCCEVQNKMYLNEFNRVEEKESRTNTIFGRMQTQILQEMWDSNKLSMGFHARVKTFCWREAGKV